MTDTATRDDVELNDSLFDESALHLQCCRADPPQLLCRRPFHPEVVTDDPEQAGCPVCTETRDQHICDRGHEHCPLLAALTPFAMPPACPPGRGHRSEPDD